MQLTKVLRVSFVVQIVFYAWAMEIIYRSSHDGVDSFAGLRALYPLGLFVILGIANFVMLFMVLAKSHREKVRYDPWVLMLALVVIALILAYDWIVAWALSGGS
jgi:hypothetical protein